MVGVPVIINHKDLNDKNVDEERVGVVNSVWYDNKDGWYWCDGIIWDEDAIDLIDKGWSVSCSYDVKTADDKGGSENNIKYDMEFLDGVFTHLALVNNPRYERANIVFNSKTQIVNGNPDQPRVPAGSPQGGQFAKKDGSQIIKPKLRDYKAILNKHKNQGLIEKYPPDFKGTSDEDIMNFLGIKEQKPAVFKTPIETVKIYKNNISHIRHEKDKTRLLGLERAIKTLQNPNIIIQDKKDNYYIKFFDKKGEDKIHLQVIKTTKQGGFYKTNFPMSKNKFEKLEGQVIYDLSSKRGLTSNNIIPPSDTNLNPNVTNRKQTFEEKFTDVFFEALAEVLLESYNE